MSTERVALLGGRPLWIYGGERPAVTSNQGAEAINQAYSALEEEFDPAGEGPIGVCVLVDDRAEIERRLEPIWPETKLVYAGYLPDGRQVRIRYFWRAEIAPGLPNSPTQGQIRDGDYSLEDRYRIEPLSQSEEITDEDVLKLWASGEVLPEEEARRRVDEVLMVAIERDTGLAGVSTVYVERNAQLRMNLWHFRTYVAPPHRHGQLAVQLLWTSRDLLERRFAGGEDTRAAGMIVEIENEGLRRYFNKAYWLHVDFTFIGENERGDHVRVHYFPGARVPVPGDGAS